MLQTYINTFMKLQNDSINSLSFTRELINKIDEVLAEGNYKNIGIITRLYELKKELTTANDKAFMVNLLYDYNSDIRDKVNNN
ncbi:hypothetical protein [Spiroplasma endosymbiont of Seladonia tumulorum]|uniref:hypothetical protein n=1 Tax=Spiroplasma endosymbiont of Seladonia tumulorum TaxID=3066321 RepID=UPI0030CC7A72